MALAWLKTVTDRLRGGGKPGRRQRDAQRRARAFRAEVHEALASAVAREDRGALEALARKPADLALPDEEVELELEALHGALDAITLRDAIAREGLPTVEHQHKALGNDRCHFVASVFLASDGSDRTGRLFLTDRRVLFLSSPPMSLSWGSIGSVDAEQRDLVVASAGGGALYRFRCNSFADARCGEVIARALKSQTSRASACSSPPDSNATAADAPRGPR